MYAGMLSCCTDAEKKAAPFLTWSLDSFYAVTPSVRGPLQKKVIKSGTSLSIEGRCLLWLRMVYLHTV